ncbi:MAG: hypothetical protein JWQ71_4510 [Pedosphaera sp.]|nr:hypothetical protein [Pedosphaera sp.]
MKRRLRDLLVTILGCCLCLQIFIPQASGGTSEKFNFADISKPDFFPILPWDAYHNGKKPFIDRGAKGLEGIAECNFNMAGFVLPQDLKVCEKLGLGAIMFPSEEALASPDYTRQWRKLSDEEIDNRIKQMVKVAGSSPAIVGYFIMDEPGVKDFPALGKAVAAVKKYAPGKLAYINLLPDYATIGATDKSQLGTSNYTEYLELFVSEVKPQLLSYDNYRLLISNEFKNREKAASYFNNLLEVRRVAQEHQLPCLNIVSANEIRPFTPIPSPANLALQAYTTLAAGYRGVTWFTYFQKGYRYAPIDSAEKKTLTWVYLKEVNRQVATLAPVMSLLTSTGVFFSAPAPTDGLPSLPGNLVESVTSSTPLMVGEFKHRDGQNYIMVVNLSLESSAKFALKIKIPVETISVISAMDRSLSPFDQTVGLWLTAGQGVLLKLGK